MLLARIWSPAVHDSPRNAALCHLCLKLAEEWLAEDSYLADVAGLHYHFSPDGMAGEHQRTLAHCTLHPARGERGGGGETRGREGMSVLCAAAQVVALQREPR